MSAPQPNTSAADREALEKRLGKRVTQANTRFRLIGPGDRVLVGMSGGKDSWVMLHLLMRARRLAPFDFTLVPFHLDQAHPGFDVDSIRRQLEALNQDGTQPFVIEREDTYSIVEARLAPGKTPCSLCSRLRRGILYSAARRHGCTKIALGHHREDLNETLLLNLFYSGTLETMPPRVVNDARDIQVIRPLALCAEAEIAQLASAVGFAIVPCTLCGRGKDLKRDRIKRLLQTLESEIPQVRNSLLAAMSNVHRSHLLDPELWPGTTLDPDQGPD